MRTIPRHRFCDEVHLGLKLLTPDQVRPHQAPDPSFHLRFRGPGQQIGEIRPRRGFLVAPASPPAEVKNLLVDGALQRRIDVGWSADEARRPRLQGARVCGAVSDPGVFLFKGGLLLVSLVPVPNSRHPSVKAWLSPFHMAAALVYTEERTAIATPNSLLAIRNKAPLPDCLFCETFSRCTPLGAHISAANADSGRCSPGFAPGSTAARPGGERSQSARNVALIDPVGSNSHTGITIHVLSVCLV